MTRRDPKDEIWDQEGLVHWKGGGSKGTPANSLRDVTGASSGDDDER